MAERIEIIVSADAATASDALDELADQIEELTGTRPEITVDATGAVSELESVADAAATTAAATEELGPAAETSIGSIKGATRDLLRPLGIARGTVGDLNDTFQLLADNAVDALGLTEQQASKLAESLPVIGVGIGLAVTAFQAFKADQEATAAEAERLAKAYEAVGEALSAGDTDAAAEGLLETNKELIESVESMGGSYEGLIDYITGASDAMPALISETDTADLKARELESGMQAARDAFIETAGGASTLGDKSAYAREAVRQVAAELGGAAEEALNLSLYLEETNEALDTLSGVLDVSGSLDQLEQGLVDAAVAAYYFGAGSEEAQDANRELAQQLVDAKQDVIDYAEQVGDIPPSTLTEILSLIDRGEIAEAERLFREVSRGREAEITADALTAAAEGDLNYTARDRHSTINVRARVEPGSYSSWGGGIGGGAQGFAAGPTALTAAPAAMAAAPQVNIRIDARGAVDPYSVGRAVEQAATSWGRVSGRWRPGLRSVS